MQSAETCASPVKPGIAPKPPALAAASHPEFSPKPAMSSRLSPIDKPLDKPVHNVHEGPTIRPLAQHSDGTQAPYGQHFLTAQNLQGKERFFVN